MQSALKSALASTPGKPTLLNANMSFIDFVTLSPQRPYVEGKGRLEFHFAKTMDTAPGVFLELDPQGIVEFDNNANSGSTNGGMTISLKPEKVGEKFLVSITTLPYAGSHDTTLLVELPDGSQEKIPLPAPKNLQSIPPILVFFAAENTSWQSIGLSNVDASAFGGWIFFKCEVRAVQPN
jgi:hypothetical protein